VRDSGIAHALLGVRDKEALLSHPVIGQTWESFVTETLIAAAPDGTEAQLLPNFQRHRGRSRAYPARRKLWAIEIKRSSAPRVERGFHSACANLHPRKRFVVYPGTEQFPLDDTADAIGVVALANALQSAR
jgi:predicted AAA+ superfamily ATPase